MIYAQPTIYICLLSSNICKYVANIVLHFTVFSLSSTAFNTYCVACRVVFLAARRFNKDMLFKLVIVFVTFLIILVIWLIIIVMFLRVINYVLYNIIHHVSGDGEAITTNKVLPTTSLSASQKPTKLVSVDVQL